MIIFQRGVVLLTLSFSLLFCNAPENLSFFTDKPRSIAKDFYIYRYLKKSTTSSEDAKKLLAMTSRMSMKLFHAFANRLNEPAFKNVSRCLKMKLSQALKKDNECLAIKISIHNVAKLDKKKIKDVELRLKKYRISKFLHVLYSKNPFKSMISGDNELFFTIFNGVGSKFRKKFLDYQVSKKKIQELQNSYKINRTIKYVITGRKLKKFNISLIHVDRFSKKLSQESLFLLGLNALQLRYNNLAMKYFDEAYKRAYFRMDKDKILFWQFLVSKNIKYKKELKGSFDLNVYTLLAGYKNERIMTPRAWKKHPFYDEKNPFGWIKLLKVTKEKTSDELKNLAKTYLYENTLPHYSFIMEKASGYKDHYFPIVYKKYLKNMSNKQIALIMAIARQESRLVPSALSHSYALGMMQFMPFLATAIAKERKMNNFDLDDMFDPKVAIKFADIHLKWLHKTLYHPLFVAYAYNGGIGFTKKLLKSGTFQKGAYEPFLSMELVYYDESRKYGKKVLANYITYMKILGEKVSTHELFRDLTNLNATDSFRKNTY